MLEDIFACSIWKVNLQKVIPTKKLKEYCLEYEKQKPSRDVSNIGGFQSNPIDYEIHKPIKDTTDILVIEANKYAKELGLNRVELDNLWININRYGESNMPHIHPNCVLSGVLYLHENTEEYMGEIVLEHGSSDIQEVEWHDSIKQNTKYNKSKIRLKCEESLLYIFPSWLRHSVLPNLSNTERVSFAFNFIKGG